MLWWGAEALVVPRGVLLLVSWMYGAYSMYTALLHHCPGGCEKVKRGSCYTKLRCVASFKRLNQSDSHPIVKQWYTKTPIYSKVMYVCTRVFTRPKRQRRH